MNFEWKLSVGIVVDNWALPENYTGIGASALECTPYNYVTACYCSFLMRVVFIPLQHSSKLLHWFVIPTGINTFQGTKEYNIINPCGFDIILCIYIYILQELLFCHINMRVECDDKVLQVTLRIVSFER